MSWIATPSPMIKTSSALRWGLGNAGGFALPPSSSQSACPLVKEILNMGIRKEPLLMNPADATLTSTYRGLNKLQVLCSGLTIAWQAITASVLWTEKLRIRELRALVQRHGLLSCKAWISTPVGPHPLRAQPLQKSPLLDYCESDLNISRKEKKTNTFNCKEKNILNRHLFTLWSAQTRNTR